MREPRAIIFDVDGTLYDPRLLRACMGASFASAFLRGPGDAKRALRAVIHFRRALERLRAGEKTAPGKQLQMAAESSGIDPGELQRLVELWLFEKPLRFLDICRRAGLTEFLEAVRSAGKRLAVLSDYPARAKLKALSVEGYFEEAADALDAEILALKPSPAGLLTVARRLAVEPGECLYIGDREDVDGRAAERAGMLWMRAPRRFDAAGLREGAWTRELARSTKVDQYTGQKIR